MSISEIILAQYEKNKSNFSGNNTNISSEDRLKKYFTTVLPKGVKSGEKRIRILPTKDGSTPFKEVFFHEILVGKDRTKLYDPEQEGKPSPLNDVREGLLMSGKESDREQAKQYRSKKFYIVKVIDRDNEQDGVKFWRFKHAMRNDGIFDKMVAIVKNKGDIMNLNEGRDLTLSLEVVKGNTGMEYTTITSIIPEDKSPLSESKEQSEEWYNDEMTWEDVYSKKPFEYLELVSVGKIPKWDSNLGKYVEKNDDEGGVRFEGTAGKEVHTPTTQTISPDLQEDEEEDDDLPF